MSNFLAFEEILAALVLLWATFRITTVAGFRSLEARWALFRRGIYSITAIALFAMGVQRMRGEVGTSAEEALYQSILVISVVTFPVLRALCYISQDTFNAFHSWQSSGRQRRQG